jgi:hypothetical protein
MPPDCKEVSIKGRFQVEIDMKFAFKSIVAAAAFVAAGVASAASVSVNVGQTVNGLKLESGSGALTFSTSLVGAINSSTIGVAQVSPAVATLAVNPRNGFYTSVSVAAPFASLKYDSVTNQVTDAFTLGGALQTTLDPNTGLPGNDGFTNSGGFLSITNIHADLVGRTVYVTLGGANGVGTIDNFALWSIGTIGGSTNYAAGTTTTTLSGLSLVGGATGDAFAKFSQSLGLTQAGKNALSAVTDFGTISSTVVASAAPSVPEPSTYALMGLGLVGISLVARRRAK